MHMYFLLPALRIKFVSAKPFADTLKTTNNCLLLGPIGTK